MPNVSPVDGSVTTYKTNSVYQWFSYISVQVASNQIIFGFLGANF